MYADRILKIVLNALTGIAHFAAGAPGGVIDGWFESEISEREGTVLDEVDLSETRVKNVHQGTRIWTRRRKIGKDCVRRRKF